MEDYQKKYEAALKQAKEELKACGDLNCDAARQIFRLFPELKESKDDRIRKEIIQFLRLPHSQFVGKRNHEEWIAWLEKQGHDGKKWIYEDVYIKEKEQVFQDGVTEVLENPQRYGLEKQGKQKPVWSEEDEKILQTLINDTEKTLFAIKQEERPDIMSGLSEIYIERLRWLKSLKERMKGE